MRPALLPWRRLSERLLMTGELIRIDLLAIGGERSGLTEDDLEPCRETKRPDVRSGQSHLAHVGGNASGRR